MDMLKACLDSIPPDDPYSTATRVVMEAENLEDMVWKYLVHNARHLSLGTEPSVSSVIVRDWRPLTGRASRIVLRHNAGASISKLFDATKAVDGSSGWVMNPVLWNSPYFPLLFIVWSCGHYYKVQG